MGSTRAGRVAGPVRIAPHANDRTSVSAKKTFRGGPGQWKARGSKGGEVSIPVALVLLNAMQESLYTVML